MFDDFYKKFPKKVARKDAQKAWLRLTAEQQQKALEAIDDHVRMWTAEGRDKQFIPHPATWLNGERFNDEISMPEKKVVAWWTSDQLTMEHGRKIGVPARPGRGYDPVPTAVTGSIGWRDRVATAVRVQNMTRAERAAAMPKTAEIVRAFAAEFSVVEVRAQENNLYYEWTKK